ncbi:hypothetical protein C8Q80DRAFT_1145563 [Daedaleopsis nitida]|nr:hypothetical protein C8Q80DRAFT_1145563 [Daedaleopsis nitida]
MWSSAFALLRCLLQSSKQRRFLHHHSAPVQTKSPRTTASAIAAISPLNTDLRPVIGIELGVKDGVANDTVVTMVC